MFNLTTAMKPAFWQRFNLGNAIRRAARENIYRKLIRSSNFISVSAANAQVYSRILVQKTATQLYEYNYDDVQLQYTKPAIDYRLAIKYWTYLTKGMS